MATPTQIRAGIGTTAQAHIAKLVVSKNLTEVQNLGDGGGLVVGGPTADYTGAMGKGLVTWNFPLYCLAPTANYDRSTEILDELVSPSGERSLVQLMWDYGREQAGGLGILDSEGRPDVDAHIDVLTAYGVEFPNAGIPHIGAVLNCVVHTSGNTA